MAIEDSKTKKPAKVATHPKYSEMVATAIETLKEKGGSSRAAIIKFITSKYKVNDNPNVVNSKVKITLKKGVESGVLTQVKGTGAIGSFKLSKKPKTADKPKKAAKKPVAKPEKVSKKAAKSPKKVKTKKAVKSPKKSKSPKKVAKSKKSPKKPKTAKSKPKTVAGQKLSKKAAEPKVKRPSKK